jgi:hypothetical protein
MSEPTERQVLYALVSFTLFVVVAVLAIAARMAGVSPPSWSVAFGVMWLVAAASGLAWWRRTGRLLSLSLAVFVVWAVGTLATR